MTTSVHIATTPVTALAADDVWKSYDDGAIPVLKGVTFHAMEGETVALVGSSGCGKSTLLHLLGGLDEPDRGTVTMAGERLRPKQSRLHLLRHHVGFVFQLHNLIPDLTLRENCLIPSVAAQTPRAQAEARLRELAERTGLTHRLDRRIQQLSGGERQRTALCRALMNRPRVVLADEPTGSLDDKTSRTVFQLLLDLASNEDITLVMATHDRALAECCHHVIEMHDGRIHEH